MLSVSLQGLWNWTGACIPLPQPPMWPMLCPSTWIIWLCGLRPTPAWPRHSGQMWLHACLLEATTATLRRDNLLRDLTTASASMVPSMGCMRCWFAVGNRCYNGTTLPILDSVASRSRSPTKPPFCRPFRCLFMGRMLGFRWFFGHCPTFSIYISNSNTDLQSFLVKQRLSDDLFFHFRAPGPWRPRVDLRKSTCCWWALAWTAMSSPRMTRCTGSCSTCSSAARRRSKGSGAFRQFYWGISTSDWYWKRRRWGKKRLREWRSWGGYGDQSQLEMWIQVFFWF